MLADVVASQTDFIELREVESAIDPSQENADRCRLRQRYLGAEAARKLSHPNNQLHIRSREPGRDVGDGSRQAIRDDDDRGDPASRPTFDDPRPTVHNVD